MNNQKMKKIQLVAGFCLMSLSLNVCGMEMEYEIYIQERHPVFKLLFNLKSTDIVNFKSMLESAIENENFDINMYSEKMGQTLLNRVIWNHELKQEERNDLVEFLIEHGADVNKKNIMGYGPLYNATCWHFQDNIIRLLIKNGADVDEACTSLKLDYCEQKRITYLTTMRSLDMRRK